MDGQAQRVDHELIRTPIDPDLTVRMDLQVDMPTFSGSISQPGLYSNLEPMKPKPNPSTEAAEVRRRAEARLREQNMGTSQARTEADTLRLVHELEVHQVESEMQKDELQKARDEAKAKHDKLWKLASNPFIVLGEARVTGNGIALTILGDLPPEPRLGLAPGSFPKTIEAALGMLHPDDRQAYQEAVERSRATGEPFDMNYRLADGHGGWRWIEGRAVAVEVRDGQHVGWVFTNRDITPQREAEAALARVAAGPGNFPLRTQVRAGQAVEAGRERLLRPGRGPRDRRRNGTTFFRRLARNEDGAGARHRSKGRWENFWK